MGTKQIPTRRRHEPNSKWKDRKEGDDTWIQRGCRPKARTVVDGQSCPKDFQDYCRKPLKGEGMGTKTQAYAKAAAKGNL